MNTVRTIVIPVRNLTRAKEHYRAATGTEPTMDSPYYVGFLVDGQQIGLDPRGFERGLTGPTPYWHVPDLRAAMDALVEAGATVREAAQEVGGGKIIATLADADGNPVGLIQEP